ncbi:MAG: ketoacyl-ACP synthase III [Candidatus Omnitrophica bacterium]|nr:ketoacyl-ACP synthase III [Candidatus Omnitrophota bacterium]
MSQPVGILGLGFYLPSKVLTNADLEKIVDTSDEWIRTRTGIQQRRIAAEGENTSDLAVKAAQAALAQAGLQPTDLDMILVATMTPDMPCPATACLVQAKLGAAQAAATDVSAACSGFLYGLVMARHMVAGGAYKHVLVVGAEVLSRFVDWKDRSTCVLFGDGAGAAVVGPAAQGQILSTYLGSDGTKVELLKVPGGGVASPATHESVDNRLHFLKMNGAEVFKHAVRGMSEAALKAVEQAGITADQIKCVVPHQANIRIIQAVVERAGIPIEKVYLNVERYGNMSAASTVVALCEAVRDGRITKGDYALLVAFGAGLTWGSAVIKW